MKLFQSRKKMRRNDSIIFNNPTYAEQKEEYSKLKDSILYYGTDKTKKVIQIASSLPGESKTTTVSNLAVALGDAGRKVCVIDLDFRKPRVHYAFRLENDKGVCDYMLGRYTLEQIIKPTEYKNVDVILRGEKNENPSFVLTSETMINLIAILREKYDFIIVDSGPVLLFNDYMHISKFSDGILFVAAYGQTKRKAIKEAISALKQTNREFIGTVFTLYKDNRNTTENNYAYSKYYDSYYTKKEKKD